MSDFAGTDKNTGIARIAPLAQRFGRWWLSEFLSLFSSHMADWLMGRNEQRLRLSHSNGIAELRLFQGKTKQHSLEISGTNELANAMARMRAISGDPRLEFPLDLEMPQSACFFRHFDIPAIAKNALPRLLTQEIERNTPFKLSDIYHGHEIEPRPTEAKLRVHQVIIRRDLVAAEADKFGLLTENLAGLVVADRDIKIPLLLQKKQQHSGALWLGALCLSALLLGLIATAYMFLRQDKILTHLEQEIARVKPMALAVRGEADKMTREQAVLAQIRLQRQGAPTFSDMLEELTRVLPNDVWLSELRLIEGKANEHQVNMMGFAAAAASLVDRVNASPLFFDASLTAAIIPDPAEKRERFSLQAQIKASQPKVSDQPSNGAPAEAAAIGDVRP